MRGFLASGVCCIEQSAAVLVLAVVLRIALRIVLGAVLSLVLRVVLGIVLVVVLVLGVVLALGIILLVVHGKFLQNLIADHRRDSMPNFSCFILRTKNETDEKSSRNSGGDSAGSCLQSTGENAEETILLNSFLYTLGKGIAEAG